MNSLYYRHLDYRNVKRRVRRLIASCPPGSIRETPRYRFGYRVDRRDGHVWVSRLDKHGRPTTWVEITNLPRNGTEEAA